MKVYVVMCLVDLEYRLIEGIYATRVDAERAVETLMAQHNESCYYDIEEHNIQGVGF